MVRENRSEGSVFQLYVYYILIYIVFFRSRIISSSYATFRLPNPLSIFTEPGILIYRTRHPPIERRVLDLPGYLFPA